MQAIEHDITHTYQPTNNSCAQAALSMLLSHYDIQKTAESLMTEAAPVYEDENGNPHGTVSQDLATWCISQGFAVTMCTFDFQIIDLGWASLSKDVLLKNMEEAKEHREVNALGKYWSEHYVQSYINFIETGGDLVIEPYPKTSMLYQVLEKAPFLVGVASRLLHTKAHAKTVGLRTVELSNTRSGQAGTHNVVVYGNDEQGNFLIADPWDEPGLHVIEPEKLICAITAAELECDNLLFYLERQ